MGKSKTESEDSPAAESTHKNKYKMPTSEPETPTTESPHKKKKKPKTDPSTEPETPTTESPHKKKKKHRTELAIEPGSQMDESTHKKKKHKHKAEPDLPIESTQNEEITTVKVQTLSEHDKKLAPIVGYFPSGFDPLAGDEAPKVRVFQHERRPKRLQLVVSPSESSKVKFAGTNFSGEGEAPQMCTFALGVLDKESLTLKILPIAANKVIRLEPKIEGADVTEEAAKGELTAENKAEKMKRLTDTYSTKKAVSQARKREALYQNQDHDIKEDLEKKAEEIKKNRQAIESASLQQARNIPPHDISATSKEMAYPLTKIILAGEWDFLMDIIGLCESEQELAPEDYPSFVRNRVHLLDYKEDQEERKKLACIFSYITHLIKFKDKHSMEGVDSAKYHKFPSIIQQKFSTMFAPSENRRLSEEKKDLLISYALVLTLFVDGFDTNPCDIAKDLRMSEIKLRPHFEHLGCKKHVREGALKYELRVPLEFPKLRQKRRRR